MTIQIKISKTFYMIYLCAFETYIKNIFIFVEASMFNACMYMLETFKKERLYIWK